MKTAVNSSYTVSSDNLETVQIFWLEWVTLKS